MKKVLVLAVATLMVFGGAAAWAADLTINGSTTVLPIAQKCVEAFMKANPGTTISLSGGGSSNGIKALIDGSTDIANASRFIKEKEVKMAVEKGIYPVPFGVAYDSIIPVVHPSNPLTNLSTDQLKDIYAGKIKNFKEVGGPDLEIVVVSRDTSSGTYETWEEKVLKGERVSPSAQVMASNGAVAQAVTSNKHAIGYVGIGYLNKDLKALTVNGIEGSEKTTLDATYPVARALYMFTNGWPKGKTLEFINYVLNPKLGQNEVADSGYVRLY